MQNKTLMAFALAGIMSGCACGPKTGANAANGTAPVANEKDGATAKTMGKEEANCCGTAAKKKACEAKKKSGKQDAKKEGNTCNSNGCGANSCGKK
jgi:hypothetical protein